MSDPLIVVITTRIKEGTLDDYKQSYRSISELVEANEPESSPSAASSTRRGPR